jgi:hypothetical protein
MDGAYEVVAIFDGDPEIDCVQSFCGTEERANELRCRARRMGAKSVFVHELEFEDGRVWRRPVPLPRAAARAARSGR